MKVDKSEGLREERGIRPGDDIIITKWIALETTVKLAVEKEADLLKRFPQALISDAKALADYSSVEEEIAIAEKSGTGAAYELAEGGILAALWNYANASGVGLDINIRKIPIRQETVEICEFFGLNPYESPSRGSVLIATDQGTTVLAQLEKASIPAVLVGQANAGNDRVLMNNDHKRFLDKPRP